MEARVAGTLAIAVAPDVGWSGGCIVREILGEEVAPFIHSGAEGLSLFLEGPELRVSPKGAQALTEMSFHELATDAAKSGAFARTNDSIHVSWNVAHGELVLRWRETGGVSITGEPPTRRVRYPAHRYQHRPSAWRQGRASLGTCWAAGHSSHSPREHPAFTICPGGRGGFIGMTTVSGSVMQESERLFRELADNAPVMVWRSGPDKLCDFFNEPWLRFTGRTMEQEQGNGWAEGVYPEDYDRCLAIYIGQFDKREEFSMDYRLRRYDGEYRWVLDNGRPYYPRRQSVSRRPSPDAYVRSAQPL